MENYTIDIAQLGKKTEGTRPVGFEEGFRTEPAITKVNPKQTPDEGEEVASEDDEDFMGDYELDLGGLGEKPSSVVIEDRDQPKDEVSSEDEGPEDFTQNLEEWMRGARKWKKEKDEDIAEGSDPEPDAERKVPAVGVDQGLPEESVFEPLGTSTPAPLRNHEIIEQGVQEEARLQAPPLTRLNTEALQDRAAEEVFDRISALQAEIERMRLEDENRRAAHEAREEEHKKLYARREVERERDQAKYEALRRENEQLRQSYKDSERDLQHENDHVLRDYEEVKEQLRALQDNPPVAKDDSMRREYEGLEKEIKDVKASAEHDRTTAESKIEHIRQELEFSRNDLHVAQNQLKSMQESSNTTINSLTTELEARTNEVALERKESIDRANEVASLAETLTQKDKEIHDLTSETKAIKMDLNHAQEQLTETRRIVETVEDENDRLVQQHERQALGFAELQAALKAKATQDQEAKGSKDVGFVDEATHKAALENLSQQHQATLSSLDAAHSKELQTLRSTLLKAGEGMQKRESKLTDAHAEQLAALNQQISTLKAEQHPKPSPPPEQTPIEKELRAAIRVLSAKLDTATTALASVRQETDQARQEVEQAREEEEDAQQTNAIVNAELEARFAAMVEKREREWRRRVGVLFREREKMGKALMVGWGREEVGVREGEEGQGYRYKYVGRRP